MSDKTWREKDRGRDGSAHRREERSPGRPSARATESATAAYKRQLNKFFDKGEVPEHLKARLAEAPGTGAGERQLLMRAVFAADAGKPLVKALDAFLAKHPLPDDPKFLLLALDHPKDAVILEALTQLDAFVETGKAVPRKPVLKAKLEELEYSSFDPRVQRKAIALASRI
ncbi:MAG: hypothetical protein ACI9U2_005215 [Bradymonadia bacterium]|jgi:hypothetical protein